MESIRLRVIATLDRTLAEVRESDEESPVVLAEARVEVAKALAEVGEVERALAVASELESLIKQLPWLDYLYWLPDVVDALTGIAKTLAEVEDRTRAVEVARRALEITQCIGN